MNKQIVFILSGLILISLFSGCLEESYLFIFNDHIEGCKIEYLIYEPVLDEECYSGCSEEWELFQQGGCEAICQEECNGCSGCLEECNSLKKSFYRLVDSNDPCQEECTEASPKSITLGQSLPISRCTPAGLAPGIFSTVLECLDFRNCQGGACTPDVSFGCTPPINYNCQLLIERYELDVYYSGEGTIYVNGTPFQTNPNESYIIVNITREDDDGIYPNWIKGIPSSITITADGDFDRNGFGIILKRDCCYDCREKKLPAAILYPKVDIEGFSIVGGSTIIKDGKIVSSFSAVPGAQKTTIQIENRGFFTQGNAMVKFVGLPIGVTVDISPNSQKIKAHNIANYEATFTVGPNVPSGTYKVTMLALSPNGTFDTIQIDLTIP